VNLSLFKSPHALTAGALLGGFWLWHWQENIAFGGGAGSDTAYLLWTGWIATALYAVLALYALRKSAHKTGLSPEFKMAVPMENLERAETQLNQIRVQILSGELTSKADLVRATKQILRREGVAKVIRVRVEKGTTERPPRLIVEPREPIGRLAKWMHVHIYFGMAAAGMVWFHGGGDFSSPMGLLLNGLSYLVILTGVLGIVLWTLGPAWLTARETDLSLEKAFSLREHYKGKVEQQAARLRGESDDRVADRLMARKPGTTRFLSTALATMGDLSPETETYREAQDLLVLVGQRCLVNREWSRLARLRFCLHIWRAVHVPASILLLAGVAVHIASIAWY
jgi:hypothetical protein